MVYFFPEVKGMLYTLKNEYLTVTVSDRGAELQSVRRADGREYLWQGDST